MSAPSQSIDNVDEHPARGEGLRLLGVMVLAAALRLLWLGTYDYNFDEALELVKVIHLREVLTQGMLLDTHAPLFPLLVAAWCKLGLGGSEWLTRLLSLFLGLGSIAVMYSIVRTGFGARTALWTALLLAVSPLHVILSRELKDQMLMVFACTLAVWCLGRAVQADRPRAWTAYGAAALLAAYTGFFAGPLLAAVNLWFLYRAWHDRLPWKRWALTTLGIGLLLIPMAVFSYIRARALMTEASRWYLPKPTLAVCACFFKSIVFGYSDRYPYYVLATMLFGMFVAIGLVAAYRRNRDAALLLMAWCALPIAFAFVVSWRYQSIFLYRMLFVYALPMYVWAALAIGAARSRWLKTLAAAGMVASAFIPLYEMYNNHYAAREFPHRPCHRASGEFKKAAEFIREHRQPGDIIIHSSHMPMAPFYIYGLADTPQLNVGAEQKYIEFFRQCFPPVPCPPNLQAFMRPIADAVAEHRRVWCVISAWEPYQLGENPAAVDRWMHAHYAERLRQSFRQCEVYLFENP